jgi:hypothetical protein
MADAIINERVLRRVLINQEGGGRLMSACSSSGPKADMPGGPLRATKRLMHRTEIWDKWLSVILDPRHHLFGLTILAQLASDDVLEH